MSWLGGVRISVKLPIIFAAAVLVTGGALALTAYRIAAVDFRAEIEDRVRDQGRERRDALAGALAAIVEDVDLNAAHPWTKRALSALANGWAALGASAPSRLWDAYVEGNPFDDDERAELDRADDDSFYSVHHETYHPWFRDLAAVRGYEDILLVNAAGRVVYSVQKLEDFALDLSRVDGPLARAFQAVRRRFDQRALGAEPYFFVDVPLYGPIGDLPASLFAGPVVDETGGFAGVFVARFSLDRIAGASAAHSGLRGDAELLLVGEDRRLRTASSRLSRDPSEVVLAGNDAVERGLRGEVGVVELADWAGGPTRDIVSFAPLSFLGATYVVLGVVPVDQVMAPFDAILARVAEAAAGVLVLVLLAGVAVARGISNPIGRITRTMNRVVAGDREVDVPFVGRGDEIGDVADAVLAFKRSRDEIARLGEEIAAERETLRLTLDALRDGVSMYGPNGEYLAWNRRAPELLEVPVEVFETGLVANVLRVLVERGDLAGDPDSPTLFEDVVRHYIQDGERTEYERETRSGRILNVAQVRLPGGRLVVVQRDVTERRRAEQAVREEREILNETLDALQDGIAMFDHDGEILAINRGFPRVLKIDEAVAGQANYGAVLRHFAERGDFGTEYDDLAGAPDEEIFQSMLARRLGDQRAASYERTLVTGDMVAATIVRLPGERLVVAFKDVTAQRRAEAALIEERNIVRAALDNLVQGVVMVGPDLEIRARNDVAGAFLGVPTEKFEAFTSFEQIADWFWTHTLPDPDGAERMLNQVRTLREVATFDLDLPDGRSIMLAHIPLDDGGFIRTYTDLTERKRQEVALREARDAAEEATKAKASFLATMSHEIRTPMNGVLSMVQVLDQTALDGEQRGMTRVVRDSAEALLTIINDILDFSKIEAGRLDIETIEFSLIDVVEGVGDLLASRAEQRGIDLLIDLDPALPVRVAGDPTRLRQILLNLGGNAIKFTEEGHVTVRVGRRLADASGDEAERDALSVTFDVLDTGIGLTEEQCARLFRPFEQADGSTARRYGGTGLGLSICKRLVDLMEGEIGVESTHGEGSRFWFRLPYRVVDPSVFSPEAGIADARVMLAGHAPVVAELIERYLRAGGVTEIVRHEQTGTALAALRESPGRVDVLFIDGQPPGADPFNVEAEVSALGEGAPKLVLNAARGLTSTIATAHQRRGFFHLMTYPIGLTRLWRTVAAALGRARLHDEAAVSAAVVWQPPPVETAREAGVLILVAEDNATNRVVIKQILDRMGFAHEIAENGRIALDMIEAGAYGLLISDFHMPEMDGFELTAAIRAREAEVGDGARLPIVALTADALPGTEQRCMDAGMDGYLTKPIEVAALARVIEERLPAALDLRRERDPSGGGPATGTTVQTAGPAVDPEVFDQARLVDVFGDFGPAARAFLDEFLASIPARLEGLAAAVEAADAEQGRDIAHSLKGAALSVGANRLGQLASDVQDAYDQDDPDTAAIMVTLLEPTYQELIAGLEPLRAA